MNVKKELFQNHYKKIVRQAWVAALVWGLAVGLFAGFVTSVAGFFFFF